MRCKGFTYRAPASHTSVDRRRLQTGSVGIPRQCGASKGAQLMPRCAMILSSLLSMALRRSSSAADEPLSPVNVERGVVGAEYECADADWIGAAAPPFGRRKPPPDATPLTLLVGAPPAWPPFRAAASRFLRMISAKPPPAPGDDIGAGAGAAAAAGLSRLMQQEVRAYPQTSQKSPVRPSNAQNTTTSRTGSPWLALA